MPVMEPWDDAFWNCATADGAAAMAEDALVRLEAAPSDWLKALRPRHVRVELQTLQVSDFDFDEEHEATTTTTATTTQQRERSGSNHPHVWGSLSKDRETGE